MTYIVSHCNLSKLGLNQMAQQLVAKTLLNESLKPHKKNGQFKDGKINKQIKKQKLEVEVGFFETGSKI